MTLHPDFLSQYVTLEILQQNQEITTYRGVQKDGTEELIKGGPRSPRTEALAKEHQFLTENPHPAFPVPGTLIYPDDHTTYGIRPFIIGTPLKDLPSLSQEELLSIATQLARALGTIHYQGLTFGDISLNNILYHQGEIKLIDFEFLSGRHATPQKIQGTPVSMAPELFFGASSTIQSDLYSLGVVLYWLTARHFPFTGQTLNELIQQHLTSEPRNPSSFNTGYKTEWGLLVLRLLKKNPSERPLMADDFIRQINRTFKTTFELTTPPKTLDKSESIRLSNKISFLEETLKNLEAQPQLSAEQIILKAEIIFQLGLTEKLEETLKNLPLDQQPLFEVRLLVLKGEFIKALPLLDTLTQTPDSLLLSVNVLYQAGQIPKAHEKLKIYLDLAKKIDTKTKKNNSAEMTAWGLNYRGNLHLFNRQLREAKNDYEQASHLAESEGIVKLMALTQMNLANSHLGLQEWNEALQHYEKALEIHTLLGNKSEEIKAELNLANLLRFLGHLEKTEALIQQTLEASHELDNKFLLTHAHIALADLHKKNRDYTKAKKELKFAHSALAQNPTFQETADYLVSRLEISIATKEQSEFIRRADKLNRLLTEHPDPLIKTRLNYLTAIEQLLFETTKPDLKTISTCFDLLLKEGDVEFALDNLLKALEHLSDSTPEKIQLSTKLDLELQKIIPTIPLDYQNYFKKLYTRAQPHTTSVSEPLMNSWTKSTSLFLIKLLKSSRDILSELDQKTLVKKILNHMMEATETERGFVILDPHHPYIAHAHQIETDVLSSPNNPEQISWTLTREALENHRPLITIDALDDSRFSHTESIHRLKLRSIIILPFVFRREVLGAVYLDSTVKMRSVTPDQLELLEALADQIGIALHNAQLFHEKEVELHLAHDALSKTQQELKNRYDFNGFIGNSASVKKLFDTLTPVIPTLAPVLIEGESGTGKELIAKILHNKSPRKNERLISINCGAIPEALLESELFGHVRGAFTGASENKKGLFEQANHGTLFLDEIGEMPLGMQVKLLRALQEKEVRPVGSTETKKIDVRIVAATNRNLKEDVDKGLFRSDLYYRLNVVAVTLPPLREREEDIPLLINFFLDKIAKDNDLQRKTIDTDALKILMHYPWPGNVRELENTLYSLAVLSNNTQITRADLETKPHLAKLIHTIPKAPLISASFSSENNQGLQEAKQLYEAELIKQTLIKHQGHISKTADTLQIQRTQLTRLMKRYNLTKESFALNDA